MTPEEVEASFSAAYEDQLDGEARLAFDAALAEDPALAQRYADFRKTLETLKHVSVPAPSLAQPEPDLLGAVQRRLRDKSGGRFYGDRFAERSGWGTRSLLLMLLGCALILAAIGAAYIVLQDVSVQP